MKNYYLKINKLNFPHIRYGFFTRKGGFSKKNYSYLNCSLSSGDKKETVIKNINTAMNILKLKSKKLKLAKQVHSNIVLEINKKNYLKEIKADGLITKEKSIAIGILTADCAPIFIFDKERKFICCLHAGWRGTLKNIVKKSIKNILKYNVSTDKIVAIIGPCLNQKNYEVSNNFKEKFIKKNQYYKNFFVKKSKNKDLFDMRGLLNFQLNREGIKNVFNIDKDTYQKDKLFFSHRRATNKKWLSNGRMINILSFK